jgi:hypothetical protein
MGLLCRSNLVEEMLAVARDKLSGKEELSVSKSEPL